MALINFRLKSIRAKSAEQNLYAKTEISVSDSAPSQVPQVSGADAKMSDSKEARVEAIRALMMSYLDPQLGTTHQGLAHRLRFATDVQALWYLRAELMGVLCQMLGERRAQEQIKHITRMFQGLIPAGMLGGSAYMH